MNKKRVRTYKDGFLGAELAEGEHGLVSFEHGELRVEQPLLQVFYILFLRRRCWIDRRVGRSLGNDAARRVK
jgi:hypothetical protein